MSSAAVASQAERAELWSRLALVRRMFKLQWLVVWAVRLLIVGLALDCVWLLGARVFPYLVPAAGLIAVPLLLLSAVAVWTVAWRPPMARLARAADRELGLKERLTTAVEIQAGGSSAGSIGAMMQGLQLRDALQHFSGTEPLEAFPIKLARRELITLAALTILAVALVLVPNSMSRVVRQREQVQQAVKLEAERLSKLADQVAAAAADSQGEDLRQIEEALRDAAKGLDQRSSSSEESLAALAALEQRLQTLAGTGGADLEDALSALAGALAQDPNTRQMGSSLARADYKQAADDLRQISERLDQMSDSERARLARSLRQSGQRASRGNQGLGQSMSQAANALEQSGEGGEGAQGALQNAADQLERASGQLRAANQRERALAQSQQSRSAISRSSQQARGQPGQSGQSGQSARGNQSGEGQQGQGRQSASGQPGSGRAGGEGDQGDEAGGRGTPGSQGGQPGEKPGGSGAGTGANPNTRGEEVYDPIFASSRQERINQDQPFEPTEALQNPNLEDATRNDARVDYAQVHARYQEKAVQSLESSYIPIGMKDLVKDYFTSLTPGK
ncbi:MAG: hypothetical protein U0821_13085 [Chloroflexota bacterium]